MALAGGAISVAPIANLNPIKTLLGSYRHTFTKTINYV